MRPSLALTLSVCFLAVAVIPLEVSAEAGPAVQWGVETGDEFTYLLQKKVLDPSVGSQIDDFVPFIGMLEAGEKMIARVDWLTPIADTTEVPWPTPISLCSLTRENDSVVMMQNMSMIIIPLNVWYLNSSQFNITYDEDSSLVNTTLQFGSLYEGQFWAGIVLVNVRFEMIYSKADGALDKMVMRVEAYWNEVVDVLITRWTPGTTTSSSTETLDDIGNLLIFVGPILGVAAATTVLVILWLKHRRRG